MNKIAYFIVGYSSMLMISSQEIDQSTLDCSLEEKEYITLSCKKTNEWYYEYLVLPEYNGTYCHRIKIEIDSSQSTILFDQINQFKAHNSSLLSLHIELNRVQNDKNPISEELKDKMNELREKLFNLRYLRELTIKHVNFNSKDHMWRLPAALQYLTFESTHYTEYNLSNLRYLMRVDFTRNQLTKLPALHYPLHSLKELYLSGNPLNEVTTKDIAKLCLLQKLSIGGTSFSGANRFCECERLRLFIGNLTKWMTTEHYVGFQLLQPLKCQNSNGIACSHDQLDLGEAINERERCLTWKYSTTFSTVSINSIHESEASESYEEELFET